MRYRIGDFGYSGRPRIDKNRMAARARYLHELNAKGKSDGEARPTPVNHFDASGQRQQEENVRHTRGAHEAGWEV